LRVAITRKVSPAIGRCELTYLAREPIDAEAADRQHRAYERCLAGLGCSLVSLPAEPGLPDSVFVEDTAIVLDELAVVTRPGAVSRRAETASVAAALAPWRPLVQLEPPGTLDGGDVLVAGRRVYVGRSFRSDGIGHGQLRDLLAPRGYTVFPVPVRGCLHLKSAVTALSADRLLVNRSWVEAALFEGWSIIDVDPAEPHAANALQVGGKVLFPAAFARTRERLEQAGIDVVTVDVSEIAKAEGAVTCCSLVFETPGEEVGRCPGSQG
jgi:dimethylargininase